MWRRLARHYRFGLCRRAVMPSARGGTSTLWRRATRSECGPTARTSATSCSPLERGQDRDPPNAAPIVATSETPDRLDGIATSIAQRRRHAPERESGRVSAAGRDERHGRAARSCRRQVKAWRDASCQPFRGMLAEETAGEGRKICHCPTKMTRHTEVSSTYG